MNDKNNIINIFKKSISSTVRAISENSDLEISYGSISKKKTENKIILPIPSLKFPESEKNDAAAWNKNGTTFEERDY